MEKLEYIPGDLVKFATNTYTIVNFEENFLHNKVCYALVSTNSTKTALVADRDILPIPLTPSILFKNGWSKGQIYFTHSRIPRIKLCTDGGISWSVSINNDIMGGYISYVHELQHILFAFKITSEMEV